MERNRLRAQAALKNAQRLLVKRSERKKGQRHYQGFAEGEQVWLEGTNLRLSHPTTKLAPRQYGPFTITKIISPVVYQLELPGHWAIHNVFHASLLTPYKEMEEHGTNYVQPPPDVIEGEDEYEVERIMDSRRHGQKRKLQFLIRWKGYSPAHDSWEDATGVNAPVLVEEYYRRKLTAVRVIEDKSKNSPTNSTTPTSYSSAQPTPISISCISFMSNGAQQEFLTGPEIEGWSLPPIDAFAEAWWTNPSPRPASDDHYDLRCPAIPTQPTNFLGSLYVAGGLDPPIASPSTSQSNPRPEPPRPQEVPGPSSHIPGPLPERPHITKQRAYATYAVQHPDGRFKRAPRAKVADPAPEPPKPAQPSQELGNDPTTSSSDSDRSLGVCPGPRDRLCPSTICAAPSRRRDTSGPGVESILGKRPSIHSSDYYGTKWRRKEVLSAEVGATWYCSKCCTENADHSYKECPTWRQCGFCDKEGHWGFNCRTPHVKCSKHRCGVHVGHPKMGRWCPWSRENKKKNFGYTARGLTCDLKRAWKIYGVGMDWDAYGLPMWLTTREGPAQRLDLAWPDN